MRPNPTAQGRRARTRAQAVVEFALILPVFLVLTLGVVDMARVFTSYISLTNGVSNAAIYAGQGGFLRWCAPGGLATNIPCPAGTLPANSSNNNPDNIAYQLQTESTGLALSGITMSPPSCTLVLGGTLENCTSTAANAYNQVKVSATYNLSLLTPLMNSLLGGPIHLTASTTAAVQ